MPEKELLGELAGPQKPLGGEKPGEPLQKTETESPPSRVSLRVSGRGGFARWRLDTPRRDPVGAPAPKK